MAQKEFQAEVKKLLDLMINSIYTHKEIFLRELISNASDALDKRYYKSLKESLPFNKDDFYIHIVYDKDQRILKVIDTGIGMTEKELEENLGVIAQSGSWAFKQENEIKEDHDLIGRFGVGFYAAFMVADVVTVVSKALGSEQAYRWESKGADGYTIEPCEKEEVGTEVILKIKENTEEEDYDQFLDEYRLKGLIKKYSDFIRYPIKMLVTKTKFKEGSKKDLEHYQEVDIVNSMVPIWRKNKNELKPEDYANFYAEKRYGFDQPLKYMHIDAEGLVSYKAILFIPEQIPYDFYTPKYEKGLELYANGVLIMQKCPELLPDYFSFVKGMVDSEDLSLNISREMLQHNRQLQVIAKNIKAKIKSELEDLLKNEREKYEQFYQAFGRQLKYGVCSDFGENKEDLQDLLMFYSSREKKLVTLAEYVSRMMPEQKYIYYVSGESLDRVAKLPQTELVADKGYEILYLVEDIDEFVVKMLRTYQEKEFKSLAGGDLGLETEDQQNSIETIEEENKELFKKMEELLSDKIKAVRASKRLKNHPVCLINEGELSIEMEKVLNAMPNHQKVKADKVLEINVNHEVFKALQEAYKNDQEKLKIYTELLYNQALLIAGLPLEDPVEFSNIISKLMK